MAFSLNSRCFSSIRRILLLANGESVMVKSICRPLSSASDPSSGSSYLADNSYYTPSPYKKFNSEPGRRYGYKAKIYTGGPLPQMDTDKPLPFPEYKAKDPFIPEKAFFGQNDFIDILGDGTVSPWQLMDGPVWLRGFRGNELERLVRRLRYEYDELEAERPRELHEIQKRIRFLYRRFNRYRREEFRDNMFVQKR